MKQANSSVRVRFAPSPTGYLHIGGLRTALFNLLFARHQGGVFLLRIEDTDAERSKSGYLNAITESLSWVSITSDEPIVTQSERFELYKKIAEKLVTEGKAYRCYCLQAEVAERHEETHTEGQAQYTKYDGLCRTRTSYPVNQAHVIRLKIPETLTEVKFSDLIRGEIVISKDQLDDFILIRSDGTPMYNFAAVVDDEAMKISHIIRGEEHIANTPKQIVLYEACSYALPQFAHIPLILAPSGEKLSKRHGAVSVLEYKKAGYLPDALVCYLARLGWSHGDQELFTRAELIQFFSLDAVGKKGAIFDTVKLNWVNAQFILRSSGKQLFEYMHSETLMPHYSEWNQEQLIIAIDLCKERVSTLSELVILLDQIYHEPNFKNQAENEHAAQSILVNFDAQVVDCVTQLQQTDFKKDSVTRVIKECAKRLGIPYPLLCKQLRFALIGVAEGVSIVEIMMILQKEKTIRRIERSRTILKGPSFVVVEKG